MIEITRNPISAEEVIARVKTDNSGCVATYVGLIRDNSDDKSVLSVEYEDVDGQAGERLRDISDEIKHKWPVNNVAIYHRVGKLEVGDVNLIVVVAAAHREEGFIACQFAIYRFKQKLPTRKTETCQDGSVRVGEIEE